MRCLLTRNCLHIDEAICRAERCGFLIRLLVIPSTRCCISTCTCVCMAKAVTKRDSVSAWQPHLDGELVSLDIDFVECQQHGQPRFVQDAARVQHVAHECDWIRRPRSIDHVADEGGECGSKCFRDDSPRSRPGEDFNLARSVHQNHIQVVRSLLYKVDDLWEWEEHIQKSCRSLHRSVTGDNVNARSRICYPIPNGRCRLQT